MNDVPVLFFEGVVSQFFYKEDLLRGSALARRPGHVASEVYAKRCNQYVWLRNGLLEGEGYINCEDQVSDIEPLSREHLHYITIDINADEEEYRTDPKAMERVLSATKGKHVFLCLKTFSEEIAKIVESIRLVFNLRLHIKTTSDVLKNTLNELVIVNEDVEMADETAQLLVDLLKQKQFHRLSLPVKCSAALKSIIASWRENSEEMVGKMVSCKEEFSELQLSSTEIPFEECTEEEERNAKRAYYVQSHWSTMSTKTVLRNRDGSAVYCLSRPSVEFQSIFLFA